MPDYLDPVRQGLLAATPFPLPDYGYGNRYGSTDPKGQGFLGGLKRPDNTALMSEYSIGVPINGQEMEIPSIVPTLSRDELQSILTSTPGSPMSDSIVGKAIDYATPRVKAGLSPFAYPGEQQNNLYPDIPRTNVPPVRNIPTLAPVLSGLRQSR